MLESKSDYLQSLNRKLSSGLLHNSQTHELNGFSNPQISLYSPLHKTDSLREIAATSKGYLRGDTRNLNDSFSDKSSKGTVLNVSQLDNVDHDRFFENFDKIFKVHQASTDASPSIEEAMKKKNICRVLLDDFELDRSMAYMNDVFHPERSLNGLVNKEKALPKLEHIPSKTYLKTEPSMSEMVPYKLTDYREISKEPVVDRVRFEFPTKTGKDKLPDLKVPKMVVNRLNTMTVEAPAPLKAHESKPYKFQDNNAKLIGKVRVNVPVQQTVTNNADMVSVRNNKNSQQALEKIVKPKKLGNLTKSKTFVLEGVKDTKGQGQSDDMRVRVNSLQGIENGPKSTGAGQKNDLSLDLGGGTKSKFFLKGLEQKTSNAGNGQGIVNKTQNELKNTRNNVTSRTYYSKENLSFLSNSNRDKALEGNHLKGIKESHNVAGRVIEASGQAPSNFHGQTVKMGAEEITKIYKELRQSLKLTESQKLAQNGRIASNSLKPINDGNNEHVPQR